MEGVGLPLCRRMVLNHHVGPTVHLELGFVIESLQSGETKNTCMHIRMYVREFASFIHSSMDVSPILEVIPRYSV